MRKFIGLFILLSTTIGSLKSQVYHEVGVGFSGLRIWELDPPKFLKEDLDYYLNPHISYQIHFWDEKMVAGTQLGWVYEKGLKNKENFFREDKRKSVTLDIEMGLNILEFKKGLLQANLGTRLSKNYLFSRRIEDRGSVAIATKDSWHEVQYDFTSSISYQLFLNSQRNPLAIRFSWEVIFPRKSLFRSTKDGKKISSIATGPSVSLIWRIKQSRNRGLF